MVSRTINDLYYVVAVNSVTLPPGEPLLAIGAALAVALLAAAAPALEAIHSAPQLRCAPRCWRGARDASPWRCWA